MTEENSLAGRVLELAIAIQQIPAPTFAEQARGRYVYERFLAEKLSDVFIDEPGNVYGRLPGAGTRPPLVISAHLDTVFPAGTALDIRRQPERLFGPGIGDNSLGVAGLFGVLWGLRQRGFQSPADLWFVANVCEEGLGDLRGMRAVVDRFGAGVSAYLILEGMALGQVYHRGLGVQRYRVRACTPGGHSWVDFGRPSAIHTLVALASQFTALVLPSQPRTTLNIGVMSGGTTVNTIAAKAQLELDLRSEDRAVLQALTEKVESLCRAANRDGIEVTCEVVGRRPAGMLPEKHPLVHLASRCLEVQNIQPNLTIGSTDANIPLSRNLPAVCLGLSTGGGAHTVKEYINIPPLTTGLEHLVAFVTQVVGLG